MKKTKTAILNRFIYHDLCTLGELTLPSGVVLYTIERPWKGNKPRISCVPQGIYTCGPRRFFRGGYDAIEVRDVPDRSYILFHIANYAHEVEGCIGVGTDWGRAMVKNSREGFSMLMEELGGTEFTLYIHSEVEPIRPMPAHVYTPTDSNRHLRRAA